jgi:hypothetical protein
MWSLMMILGHIARGRFLSPPSLPSPSDNVSESSSPTVDHVSISHVSPIVVDVLPDSTDDVPTEETDPTLD